MKRLADYLSLVKFGHSIFALPFALQSAWLAAGGIPDVRTLLLICVCAVCARTAAMGFNRLVDRDVDARNPRTLGRELPAGTLRPGGVRLLVATSSVLFCASAFLLNTLAGWLSFPVLACLLGYSYVKRISSLAHVVLGISLALAPLGAWVAVTGSVSGDLVPVLALAAAVATWVFGFDLIYACQDIEFDREEGLHSVPARIGIASTLRLAALAHVLTTGLLVLFWWRAGLGWIYAASIGVAAVLLVFEHRIVKPDDLSRVNVAFFTLNGWVGVGLFIGLLLDLAFLELAMAKREPDPATQIALLKKELESADSLARGYVLKGEERYFAEKGVELIMKKAAALSFEVSRHDAGDPDFNQSFLMDDLSAAPMFATGRLIVLRRGEKVLKGGKDAPLTRAINAWLANEGQPGAVAICASSLRADHAVSKAIVKAGGAVVSCRKLWDGPPPWDPDPRKAENVQWLMRRASEMGVRLDSDRAAYIAAATGNDLFALEGQLEKLKHSGTTDLRDVIEWQSGSSPFALAEELCVGDLKKSVAGVEALFKGGFQGSDGTRTLDRPALVAILLGSLRKLVAQGVSGAHVMNLGGDLRKAAKAAGVPPTERALGGLQARLSARPREDWSRLAKELLEVERLTRTGAEVDANDFCRLALSWKTKPQRRGR